jgi:hypothetical protein
MIKQMKKVFDSKAVFVSHPNRIARLRGTKQMESNFHQESYSKARSKENSSPTHTFSLFDER